MKEHVLFVCQNCGYESVKWLGKCPECQAWSTFSEEIRIRKKDEPKKAGKTKPAVRLVDRPDESFSRISTGIGELDRTLGGGIVPGSVVMIGGDPGIGKSTLMLQMLDTLKANGVALYVSGEESWTQIHMRARRLGIRSEQISFSPETDIDALISLLTRTGPTVVVIDSIQTLYNGAIESIPGNVSQLRTCTGQIVAYAKEQQVPVFLVGHVTKEGNIAGPKVLEHMVDTVMYFEGDTQYDFRILRCTKNRFGPVNEIGIFKMGSEGLVEVANPSEAFLAGEEVDQSGDALVITMEGNRPFIIKIQALVTKTQFGMPQRTATGIDHKRLNLLLAVLEKRFRKPFGFNDVFVKVSGGFRIDEPAADLGICMALISGLEDFVLPKGAAYIGEIGLGGEIRNVNRLDERVREAERLGLKEIIIPRSGRKVPDSGKGVVQQAASIGDLLKNPGVKTKPAR
jgi:DNA repair protein RadA/Sms